jgi:hypothetical protein
MIKVEGAVAAVALVTSWVAAAWSSHGGRRSLRS